MRDTSFRESKYVDERADALTRDDKKKKKKRDGSSPGFKTAQYIVTFYTGNGSRK